MKKILSRFGYILPLVLLAGCSQTTAPPESGVIFVTATPGSPNVATAPTNTPIPPTPTLIPVSSTVTPLPEPTATPSALIERVQFATGTTSSSKDGTLAPNGIQTYHLQAQAEQWMRVEVTSTDNAAKLAIYGLDGSRPLIQVTDNLNVWQGLLPTTQDYAIDVISTDVSANTSYTLNITIPERVQFAVGETYIQLSGTVANNQTRDYVLRAQAGQRFEALLSPPNGRTLLAVHGVQNGKILLPSTANSTDWRGTLPDSQDYLVQVIGNGGGEYILDVTIDAIVSVPSDQGDALPQAIQFGSGETTAVVNGLLSANNRDVYSIQASAGQLMLAELITSNSTVLRIDGQNDGVTYVDGTLTGASSWQGILPQNQDYILQVIAPSGADNVPYALSVTIPAVIQFESGGISTEKTGTVVGNQIHTYSLEALGGQTMTVSVTSFEGGAGLDIVGFTDGQSLITAPTANWSGVLPMTQDYLIKVLGNGGARYRLDVTVQ